jgi:hypothetical protein
MPPRFSQLASTGKARTTSMSAAASWLRGGVAISAAAALVELKPKRRPEVYSTSGTI